MALCTVDYVRSQITTILTDTDIGNIIDEIGSDVLARCDTTDETNSIVILAGKYATLAAVLTKMKTSGELAASVQTPEYRQQNTTDADIIRYETKSESFIAQYRASSSYSFSSPSFHAGFTHHHCGGHHG